MHLYFIRHAQSENNQRWALTGSERGRSADPDLTSVGRQQAEKLADFLARPAGLPGPPYDVQNVGGFAITHLYCSLMLRAVSTGVPVARALGLPLVAWEEVHEIGGIHQLDEATGERRGLPGKNRAYFESHFPDLVLPDRLGEEGWWNRPFEQREARPGRARRFVDQLLARHGGTADRVAVISHGGFYNHVMGAIFGLPEDPNTWFSLNNTGITRVDLDEDTTWLGYANRVDFLPAALVT